MRWESHTGYFLVLLKALYIAMYCVLGIVQCLFNHCITSFADHTHQTTPRNSVILLPLGPASLKHKNPQRCKLIHGMYTVGCKDGSSDLTGVLVEISLSCNFFDSYYDCHLMMDSLSLCCALKKKDYNYFNFNYT